MLSSARRGGNHAPPEQATHEDSSRKALSAPNSVERTVRLIQKSHPAILPVTGSDHSPVAFYFRNGWLFSPEYAHGIEKEASIPGAGREKRWDVAWQYDGKYRLGLSLKSILRNLGGTVPNRIDDLIGEVANAQLHSPEIVIGYVMIFNVQEDAISPRHRSTWADLLRTRLESLSGRGAPSWTTGTVEDFVVVEVDFGSGSEIRLLSQPFAAFFDALIEQVSVRNPNAVERS